MMDIIIGSARIGENGGITGGKAGDQKQTTMPDYAGEVSMQKFYVHKKGWNVIRPKSVDHANKIAQMMQSACNNPNLGYDQNERLGVIRNGVNSPVPTECDCSSLVRSCVKEATGKEPINFTTANAVSALANTGLFEKAVPYTSGMELFNGDILCTKTKGHIVIVVSGNPRKTVNTVIDSNYYPAYKGSSNSLVDALKIMGIDSSKSNRMKLAVANGVVASESEYKGSAQQNMMLLALAKNGNLKKA